MAERNAKGQFTGNVFNYDSLTPNMKRLLPTIDAAVDLTFDSMVPVSETFMRQNAPWKDQTANARNGLTATHEAKPMVIHTLILFHTMPYGVWLEIRQSGKYAIIGPALLEMSQELTKRVTVAIAAAVRSLPE